jgi:uncharacterized membrane protein YfcA
MLEPLTAVLLFFAGIAVGFINVMAGGGSAVSLPLLIFLGYDAAVANGTNRVAILVEAVAGVASFKKNRHSHFTESLKLSVLTIPGAILGAIYAVRIDDQLFRQILGVVMILIVVSLMLPRPHESAIEKFSRSRKLLVYPAMFVIGFYGGFIQAGVGFLLMAALLHLLGESLVRVNMHKTFIVAIFTVPALAIFVLTGNVDWIAALILSLGAGLGGWWAAHVAVRKGDRVIRMVLAVSLILLAIKLWM